MSNYQTFQNDDGEKSGIEFSSPTSVLSPLPIPTPGDKIYDSCDDKNNNINSINSINSTNSSTNTDSIEYSEHTDYVDNFKLTPSSYHISLETFIHLLPNTIRNSSHEPFKGTGTGTGTGTAIKTGAANSFDHMNSMYNNKDDPIAALFRRLTISKKQLEPFCFIDKHKNYTRNLIATDDETFTLLLLCWNPGKYSPIHAHPCDGCWMRVCQGSVNEVRYDLKKGKDEEKEGESSSSPPPVSFVCTMDTTFEENEITYIHDNLGYHKVGNPSNDLLAMSIHLYSPPFNKCKIWMDPCDAASSSMSYMCNFSEYGHKVITKKK
eukprot:192075_1